eukprot:s121_g24.t1
MATQTANPNAPWRCKWCKRLNKAVAEKCGACHTSWQHCIDVHFVHGQRQRSKSQSRQADQDTQWNYAGWNQSSKSRKTNRRATTPKDQKKRAQEPKAPSMPDLDPPWNNQAATTMPSAEVDPTEARFVKLAAALQAPENQQALSSLTPEVQQMVADAKVPLVTSKDMHQAVRKVEQARKHLVAVQKARANLHTNWTNYIEKSVARWKTFAEDFVKQDKDLEEQVEKAKTYMQETRDKQESIRDALLKQDSAYLEEIDSAEEMEEESLEKIATSEAIQQGIASMVTSLENIKVRPLDDANDQESAAKKPRTVEGGDGSGESSFGSKALTPFAKPGK